MYFPLTNQCCIESCNMTGCRERSLWLPRPDSARLCTYVPGVVVVRGRRAFRYKCEGACLNYYYDVETMDRLRFATDDNATYLLDFNLTSMAVGPQDARIFDLPPACEARALCTPVRGFPIFPKHECDPPSPPTPRAFPKAKAKAKASV